MEKGIVHERFMQFYELLHTEIDAASIYDKIMKIISQSNRFHLVVSDCWAQASDRASIMSGKGIGVQKLLREKANNPCIFVHCYAYRLNLVLSEAATEVSCENFLSICSTRQWYF